MVSGNLIMQMPPDPLDGISLRGIFRQVVNSDARMFLQVVLNCSTRVETGIVTNDMDASITAKDATEVIEVLQESGAVPAIRPSRHQTAGVPRQGTQEVLLLVGAGCFDGSLLTSRHPHGTDLGIGADLGFVLEESDLVIRQRVQQTLDFQDFGVVVGVFRSEDGARSSPDHLALMQVATHGFATDVYLIFTSQQQYQYGTGPSAAQVAKVQRGVRLNPGNDVAHPPVECDGGGLRSNARDALKLIALLPSGDGSRAAIQRVGNLLPG